MTFFGNSLSQLASPPRWYYRPHRLSRGEIASMGSPQTTQEQKVSSGDPLSRYLAFMGERTQEGFKGKSLFVQIGVLSLTWLIGANVTGERQTSVSLTLALRHGVLFRMHRYRSASSKSHSRPLVLEGNLEVTQYPTYQYVHRTNQEHKGFLTRLFKGY